MLVMKRIHSHRLLNDVRQGSLCRQSLAASRVKAGVYPIPFSIAFCTLEGGMIQFDTEIRFLVCSSRWRDIDSRDVNRARARARGLVGPAESLAIFPTARVPLLFSFAFSCPRYRESAAAGGSLLIHVIARFFLLPASFLINSAC